MYPLFPRRLRAAAALAVFLSLSATAAEPLSLAEAQTLAIGRSQQLAASNASINASRQMAIAAGQLPDPVLRIGVDNVPTDGPDRWSLTRDFMTMRRIGLMQELTRREKRELRSERFEREALRTQAESQLQVANIRRDTALAWIDRYYTQQMRELVLRLMAEAGVQLETARAGYGAARNSQADVFAAAALVTELEDRLSQIDKQERNAAQSLARWVGADAQRPVSGPPAWQTSHLDDGRLEEHFLYHPDLIMLRAQVEVAQTEARLAQANKKPDWSVEAMYSQRGPAYSNMISFGVSVPLQWDQRNRQDRELAAKLAMVEEARAKYEEMLRSYDAEVRNLLNDWRVGKARVARYREELIPLARQRFEASLIGYRTGKSDLAIPLLARRDQIDVLMQALTVEMETARAWAQLNFLIPDQIHGVLPKEKP